ncbi:MULTISPECIES: QueT transporter family protein [Streptococcus]|uniref:QueT transporter family protein n=1 Tax=Streptococcus caledonicus TaxID=2614158 RepID=A0ABW0UEQ5_9STRE|nr:QueT transporter family protein [Streptococcus sp. S784/96/1]
MKNLTIRDFVQVTLVAALYVVLTATPPLNAIASGMYQFRMSEMLNFLAFYNRKYIWSVTIGCMIANAPFVNPMSLGAPDILIGGLSTLIFVTLGVILFDQFKKKEVFGGQFILGHLFFAVFFAATMFTIAWELKAFLGLPFLSTWAWLFLGELSSLIFGAFIIKKVGDRIDLTK